MSAPKPNEREQPEKGKTKSLRTQEPLPAKEEETRFFREKYQPPFVTFVGSGRRLEPSLTPLQAVALAYAFPAFLGKATVDRTGAAEPEWAQELRASSAYNKTAERQLALRGSFRRRYSGDSHEPLPRERYFGLYADGAGERSYTLLGELNAYAVPLKTGYCAAVPLSKPGVIGIVFRGLPGEPNPLRRFVTEPDQYGYLFDGLSYTLVVLSRLV